VLASIIAKFLKHVYFQTEAKWHEKIHQSLEAENKHHQTSRSLQPSWASQLPRRKNNRDKWQWHCYRLEGLAGLFKS